MLAALLFALVPGTPVEASYRVLFLGNSHTTTNDVPGLVKSSLKSAGMECETKTIFGAHLDDLEDRADVIEALQQDWTHVVFQGAMISSSHKYEYPQDKAIALAKRAKDAKVLYFAEWPRKGWDESDYIYDHYAIIRKQAGGEIVPICHAWDAVLKSEPSLALWTADGNHAELPGSFLAANTIAYWIAGTDTRLTFVPANLDLGTGARLRQFAWQTVSEARKSR